MREEANRESREDNEENFMMVDDAIDHCNVCAGPIWDGDSVTGVDDGSDITIDRHGETVVVHFLGWMVHTNPQQCRVEVA
jgi:hypothetical protein